MGIEEKIWLKEFMGSVEIQRNAMTYPLEKNIEIQAIIFLNSNIPPPLVAFAHKIMQACHIAAEKYLILDYPVTISILKRYYPNLTYIFNYGIPTNAIIPYIQADTMDSVTLHNVHFIQALNFEEVNANVQVKTYFWNNILKPFFNN